MKTGKWFWLAYAAVVLVFAFIVTRQTVIHVPSGGRLLKSAAQTQSPPKKMQVSIRKVKDPPPPAPSRPSPKAAVKSDSAKSKPIEGAAPFISADYRKHLGFPGYVRAMKGLGGMFLIYDPVRGKIKGSVDPETGALSEVDTIRLASMSPRMRELSGEVAVEGLISGAVRAYGEGRYAVILLVPNAVDAELLSAVQSALRNGGIEPREVTRLEGEYVPVGSSLNLALLRAVTSDGRSLPVTITIPL